MAAARGLKGVIAVSPPDLLATAVLPALERLAAGPWFTSRATSASLFPALFARADDALRPALLTCVRLRCGAAPRTIVCIHSAASVGRLRCSCRTRPRWFAGLRRSTSRSGVGVCACVCFGGGLFLLGGFF